MKALVRHVLQVELPKTGYARVADGTVKKKVLPLPGLLSTQILPLCASTSPLATANPMPDPVRFSLG